MTPGRDDNETTTRPPRCCPVCGTPFHRVRRQTYCSPACKQVAWRARAHPDRPAPTQVRRRDQTVYQCIACDTRYVGEQWCTECARPCRSLGPGGRCAHCGEPLTIEELITGDVLS